ncbi:VOC family protein [Streptomyces sp. NPDC002033]|uniref:VOC family protein n=1 Tax=unclassified Streptomyces TaxID=2593676 RepID=UPI0033250A9D
MIAELQCVVLDCPEPLRLAEFYAGLLGGEVNRPDRRWTPDREWATLHTPHGQVLCFQLAVGHRPPAWPDPERPQQFHLDLAVPDLDRGQAQVLERGAVLLEQGPATRDFRVFADPAGHPFCLVQG